MGHVGVGAGSCRGVVGWGMSCIAGVGRVGVGLGGSCRGGGWVMQGCGGVGCVMHW